MFNEPSEGLSVGEIYTTLRRARKKKRRVREGGRRSSN
jgi:hypothetical protein